jgi:hypothetical protein
MRHLFGCGLAVLGMVLSLSLPARADMPAGTISGFNEAVRSDDPAVIVAAARQMGATAIAHPEDPQAAAAAFEAANQLCLRGACADAVPMVTFLSQREESPPVSQAEFDVLAAFATWSASDAGATADDAFRAALAANETAQPSLLTVTAFEAFYVPATQTSDWAEITSRTHMAASHLNRSGIWCRTGGPSPSSALPPQISTRTGILPLMTRSAILRHGCAASAAMRH